MPPLPRPAVVSRFRSYRLRPLPHPLASRDAAVVIALRSAGAVVWRLPHLRGLVAPVHTGPIGGVARGGGARRRARVEVRRIAADRRRFGGGHGAALAHARETRDARAHSARPRPFA